MVHFLITLIWDLLRHLLGHALSEFSVNRERRRQMRQLLKRARGLLQEGEYERARVYLGAALSLRPDTKRLLAAATQLREELALLGEQERLFDATDGETR